MSAQPEIDDRAGLFALPEKIFRAANNPGAAAV
jgi:hypothetical protein